MSVSASLADQVLTWLWANKLAVAGWIIALAAFVVVPFRRSPAEARSWLLIFLALPWLGVVVYWLIGHPRYSPSRQQRYRDLPTIYERIGRLTAMEDPRFRPQLADDNLAVANLVRGLGPFPAMTGNSLVPLSAYHAALERVVEDIETACHHVHLAIYIFLDDHTGRRIMAALERASSRGVTCRVLIDALGSYGSIKAIKQRLEPCGIEVRDILPLRRRWTSSRVDLRNHRKIIVIDGRIGFTGSQNIWDPAAHGRRANRDLLLRLTGPVVLQLQAVFVADWYLETLEELVEPGLFPEASAPSGLALQVLATGPDNPRGGIDLVVAQAMHNAAQEICIVTPYFVPNDALLNAITAAAIRGVRVALITSRTSDHRLAGLAQRSYYSELLSIGVEIHLYGPDFLHAKHLRVDREVSIIGSSNMDVRSFELNAEIDLLCYDAASASQLQELEHSYLAHSARLTRKDWEARLLPEKIMENSARLMSELI